MVKLSSILWTGVVLGACVKQIGAAPTTITFEGFPTGSFSSYTVSGVTFRAVGGGLLGRTASGYLRSLATPQEEIRADIAGGATIVSVALGDAGGDSDLLFLEVFDGAGNFLDGTAVLLPAGVAGFRTLSISEPGVAYAVFGARQAADGSSVFVESLTFDRDAVIPAPGALLLGVIGAGLVGCLRWRGA